MALNDLLEISSKFEKKQGMSDARVKAIVPEARKAISFWREYPDLMVDFMCSCAPEQKDKLNLFFYQRVFLRGVIRHRHAFCTFPRAYSKSFLSVLILIIRCILFPGSKLFVSTGGKEQAAGITKEKVEELCTLIPGLQNELDLSRGKTRASKEDVSYIFKNGSELDIMAASQKSRGKRKTGGLLEECILIDKTILNEVLIPTMNVDRRLGDGSRMEEETTNKSQIYVTTAGWKNGFARPQRVILQIVGELKLCEPQNEGVAIEHMFDSLLTLNCKERCAKPRSGEGSETIERAKALSRVGER